ncbi:MAG: hypothetical protein IPK75_18815 [Acidobacteria bacterium]|nr:hypothetical protein [Acidobacteriota bacterium]
MPRRLEQYRVNQIIEVGPGTFLGQPSAEEAYLLAVEVDYLRKRCTALAAERDVLSNAFEETAAALGVDPDNEIVLEAIDDLKRRAREPRGLLRQKQWVENRLDDLLRAVRRSPRKHGEWLREITEHQRWLSSYGSDEADSAADSAADTVTPNKQKQLVEEVIAQVIFEGRPHLPSNDLTANIVDALTGAGYRIVPREVGSPELQSGPGKEPLLRLLFSATRLDRGEHGYIPVTIAKAVTCYPSTPASELLALIDLMLSGLENVHWHGADTSGPAGSVEAE